MEARPQLPDPRWPLWRRNVSVRTGILTGICVSFIFVAWLIVANRFPQLEPFAGIRNVAAGAMTILFLAIPVLRFRHEPVRMLVSGLTAWTILTFAYITTEMHFSLLESRMGAFHIFMLGAFCYGFVAVFDWVFLMCAQARHRHMVQSGQAVTSISRPRTN